jgi:hypothetical protein
LKKDPIAYAVWRQIRFDHAWAHLADDSLNVACELLGCTVDVGPAYWPDDHAAPEGQ